LSPEERDATLKLARAIVAGVTEDTINPLNAVIAASEKLTAGKTTAWAIDATILRLAQEVVRLHELTITESADSPKEKEGQL
jgi:hypothetical protein